MQADCLQRIAHDRIVCPARSTCLRRLGRTLGFSLKMVGAHAQGRMTTHLQFMTLTVDEGLAKIPPAKEPFV